MNLVIEIIRSDHGFSHSPTEIWSDSDIKSELKIQTSLQQEYLCYNMRLPNVTKIYNTTTKTKS